MIPGTPADREYALRLQRLSHRRGWLRKIADPQRLYGRHLRSLNPGFILDVGCGLGRCLDHVGGHGVGIDSNPACVQAARAAGYEASLPEDFNGSVGSFDSLLFAHVLEHVSATDAERLIKEYLPYLRDGGRVIVICPQQRGQRSDPTHIRLVDRLAMSELAKRCSLEVVSIRSFPLPRLFGRVFTYNENVAVLRVRPATATTGSDRE
jgi:SAM-dependent methyltransferase